MTARVSAIPCSSSTTSTFGLRRTSLGDIRSGLLHAMLQELYGALIRDAGFAQKESRRPTRYLRAASHPEETKEELYAQSSHAIGVCATGGDTPPRPKFPANQRQSAPPPNPHTPPPHPHPPPP